RHDLATSVQVGDAAADLRAELHGRDIANGDGRPTWPGGDDDFSDIVETLKTPAAANQVLSAAHLEHPATDILVRARDRAGELGERDVVGEKLRRIGVDLILLLES